MKIYASLACLSLCTLTSHSAETETPPTLTATPAAEVGHGGKQAPVVPKTEAKPEKDLDEKAVESIPLRSKIPDQPHVDDDYSVFWAAYRLDGEQFDIAMVIRFKSMDELIQYSRGKLKHTDAQIDRLVERISTKIDFAKSDLVIAYQCTGGPPFGNFVHEFKEGKLQFRLHKEKSAIEHLALGDLIELFRIPKGMEVEEKNTKRGNGQKSKQSSFSRP